MDTKYWGPGAWVLLHTITFAVPNPNAKQKEDLSAFLGSIPYILPCKYCRASFSEYIVQNPLEDAIQSNTLGKWLYTIHNCVNAKLRGQHLRVEPDPPFSKVKELYTERLKASCTKTTFHGWEFLFSIVENHPLARLSTTGKPMQNSPEPASLKNSLEKNQWNLLTAEERMPQFIKFWETLPKVFPFSEWKKVWNECPTDWSTRKSALKSLWGIRCKMERELELLNSTNFYTLCKELRSHRSGCAKSQRAKTCRKKRNSS